MFSPFLSACVLAFLTVATHATGIGVLLRRLMRSEHLPTSVPLIARLLLRIIWWLVLLHLTEISVWGLFYLWRGCLPDAETAFYFSGVTYTTMGYGDVVLTRPWRLLAPVEGLIGVLMCGLSTGYFFVVGNFISQRMQKSTAASASE
jgi:hypothetical protein